MQTYALSVAAVAAALLLSSAPAAMAADPGANDASTNQAQTTGGGMENPDRGTAPMNPTDEAPAMVPGSATPGTDMKSGEIEATGKPHNETDAIDTTGKTGTGSYDTKGTFQSDEDVEANADLSGSNIDPALQEKNLKEAMDPKNARAGTKAGKNAGNGEASGSRSDTGTKDM